jgi:hypothetical protein
MFPADYAASHAEQTAGSSDVCLIDILDKLGYFVRAKSESLRWLIGSAQTWGAADDHCSERIAER